MRGKTMQLEGAVTFKLPEMRSPFGMSVFDNHDRKSYSIELDATDEVRTGIKNLEESIKKDLSTHIHEIYGDSCKTNPIESDWNSNLKDGRLRLKCDHTTFWDTEGSLCRDEKETGYLKNHIMTSLVELGGVYFMRGKVGLIWKAKQMKIIRIEETQGTGLPRGECLL